MNNIASLSIEDGIGILTVDAPPVNAIGAAVRRALDAGMRQLIADPAVKAILLICKGRTFFAGADIAEFGTEPAEPAMDAVLAVIEDSPKPVIAAIHGTALGGGLELALVCHHRIAVPSAKVGLPEVHLGLLPGAGGTQRLPRVVGVDMALDMIVFGRPIGAREALDVGLLDRLAEEGRLRADGLDFARHIVAEGKPLVRVRDRQDKVEPARATPEIFADFRANHPDAFRGVKAPDAILRAVKAAVDLPFDEGIAREWALLGEVLPSIESQALRYAFFAERRTSKIPDVPADTPNLPIIVVGPVAADVAEVLRDVGVTVMEGEPGADVVVATTGDIAEHPGRAIGLHFSSSARLLEVVRGAETDAVAIMSAMKLGRAIGKVPVLTRGGGLPIATRLIAPFRREAEALVQGGIAPATVDRALYDFGFATGLFGSDIDGAERLDAIMLARLLDTVAAEGARMIEESIVLRASDIDMIAIHGCGWPAYKGGPMFRPDNSQP